MSRLSDSLKTRKANAYYRFVIALFFSVLLIAIISPQNGGRCVSANASLNTPVDLTVTRSDDRNGTCVSGVDCSLREAVATANATAGDETIIFASGISMITLTLGEIV